MAAPKKSTGAGIVIVLAIAAVGGIFMLSVLGALGYYGVKRYVQNSRMAAAKIASAKHPFRYEGGIVTDGEGFSIAFPATPTLSTREEHDGEMRVSMATIENGPTQLGAGKTELFGVEKAQCREVLAAMQSDMLAAVKCKPTSSTPAEKKIDFAFECDNGVRGRGRLVCDPSQVESARRGIVYTAMYYAVPKAYAEADARAFLDSMKTR